MIKVTHAHYIYILYITIQNMHILLYIIPLLIYRKIILNISSWLVSFLTRIVGNKWHYILVIEHNVRNPDGVWGNSDGGDAQIMIRIPSELHVCPLLNAERNGFISKADSHTKQYRKQCVCGVWVTKYHQERTK